ncbi:MAG: metalloregulator ArsR/SmtB family transcription factor [Polyangiaceae bacterium]
MRMAAPVFRALGDPTRRALFEKLMLGEKTVADLTATLHVSQPAVSQHLAVLRASKLARMRKEGRQNFYRADPAGLAPLLDWLEHYKKFWPTHLDKLKNVLEKM